MELAKATELAELGLLRAKVIVASPQLIGGSSDLPDLSVCVKV